MSWGPLCHPETWYGSPPDTCQWSPGVLAHFVPYHRRWILADSRVVFQISRPVGFKNPSLGLSRLKGAEDTLATIWLSMRPYRSGVAEAPFQGADWENSPPRHYRLHCLRPKCPDHRYRMESS